MDKYFTQSELKALDDVLPEFKRKERDDDEEDLVDGTEEFDEHEGEEHDTDSSEHSNTKNGGMQVWCYIHT